MGKYLKLFNNHSQYETFINGGGVELPNVSHCVQENDVHYNLEQRVIVKFNVTSTDTPTKLTYNATSLAKISKIEIDGVILDPIAETYTFDTIGEHTVKYTLVDPTVISGNLFRGCDSITKVRIPKNIESIGTFAFSGCTNLTKINIPNSVESIDTSAFTNCTSLPVENNIRYADTYAVVAVDNTLTTYTIKQGTKFIGNGCFSGNANLETISIPNTVTTISNYAFQNCTSLASITIPDSVTRVDYNAFNGCTSLPIENNIRYADIYLLEAVDKTQTTYTIKEGTKFIYGNAFQNCTSLTSITIPSSIKDIYGYAFDGCSSLTSINIPNNLTSIKPYVFRNCTSLTNITIPNGVTNIDNSVFYNCTNLSVINIPSTVTRIGLDTFYNTPWWTEYSSNANNQYGNIVYINNIAVKAVSTTITSCELKQETVSISRRCFENCNSINSITSLATKAPTIEYDTFRAINTDGTLYVPQGSIGYNIWMDTENYYLGKYGWTKVEQ